MSNTLELDFDVIKEQNYEGSSFAQKWIMLPIDPLLMDNETINLVHRLNSFGSLFYFSKIVLRKHRFSNNLHKLLCENIERDFLKELLEVPRDHFKSTICSESAPIWWGLPFTERDEMFMRQLGYDDAFIRYMYRVHDQDTRTLLVSENITNSSKLGKRIDFHYQNNKFFINLFPEVKLDEKCAWSQYSMTHKRSDKAKANAGEGTFDFLGVGGALQSRHYDRVVQDDLVGRDAIESEKVMNDTIDYHKLLVGAFDSDPNSPDNDNDEIIVGNRWAYSDLNSYIRKEEPRFHVSSHSAIGGCCDLHPAGVPIFPEEFSIIKLMKLRDRLKTYFFSCQFLNNPTPPGDTKFKVSSLRFYKFEMVPASDPREPNKMRVKIVHYVDNGEIIRDVFPGQLQRFMVIDPNHSGDEGRSRHAIVITGVTQKPYRVYLLDMYAKSSSHAELVHQIFTLAEKWKIRKIHLETIAAQKWLKYHLEVMNEQRRALGKWTIEVAELKSSHGKDAKIQRIESLEPMFDRRELFIQRSGQEQFIEEFEKYPYAQTRDILDVLGYSSELWASVSMNNDEVNRWIDKNKSYVTGRMAGVSGY